MSGRGSPASALQRLAGELLGATSPAAIGTLVATTAADLLGADAAVVFARAGATTLEALHTSGWPEEVSRPFRRLELHRGRPLSDAVLDGHPVWLEDAAQWRLRYPDMAVARHGGRHAGQRVPAAAGRGPRPRRTWCSASAGPRAFSAEEREFLMAVTALCAQGLDRARLLVAERTARETAERQLGRMTFLSRSHASAWRRRCRSSTGCASLADLAVPGIADWCAVHLVRGDRVDQVAVAHSDPEKVAFVARLQERYPPDPDADGRGDAGQPHRPARLLPRDPRRAARRRRRRRGAPRPHPVDRHALRGGRAAGRCAAGSLGALTLAHAESEQRFDHADLAFAQQLAANAAIALDNARL